MLLGKISIIILIIITILNAFILLFDLVLLFIRFTFTAHSDKRLRIFEEVNRIFEFFKGEEIEIKNLNKYENGIVQINILSSKCVKKNVKIQMEEKKLDRNVEISRKDIDISSRNLFDQ